MSLRFNWQILCNLFDKSTVFEPVAHIVLDTSQRFMVHGEFNGEPFRLQPSSPGVKYTKLEGFAWTAPGFLFYAQHIHHEKNLMSCSGEPHEHEVRMFMHLGYDEKKLEAYRQKEMMASFEPTQLFSRNTYVGRKDSGPELADTPIIGRTCNFPVENSNWRCGHIRTQTLGGKQCNELSYVWNSVKDGPWLNAKAPNVHLFASAMDVYLKVADLLSLNVHIDNQFHPPTGLFDLHELHEPEAWIPSDSARLIYKTYWKQFDFQTLKNFGLIAPEHDRSRGAKNRGKQSKRESVTV